MKASFQKLSIDDSSLRVFERINRGFPFDWHYHPEYELTFIVRSQGQRLVGNGIEDYGAGDLVLLGPNLPHSWCSDSTKSLSGGFHRAVVVQFREDFLGEELFRTKALAEIGALLQESSGGLSFSDTAAGITAAQYLEKLPSLPRFKQITTLLMALADLAAERNRRKLSRPPLQSMCQVAGQRRVSDICRYLEEHYTEGIEFDAIASKFNMDQTSLCRVFRKATGRTLTGYINELRVDAAAQLLINTDDSILNVCFRAGFGNYSSFNRHFTRIKGRGPRTLRQEFLRDSPLLETSRGDER